MDTHMGILASVCTFAYAHLCLCISMAVLSGKGAVCVSFGTITSQKCVLLILFFLKKLFLKFALLCHASFLHLRHLFSTSSGNRLEEKEEEERNKGSSGHKQRLLNPVTLLA